MALSDPTIKTILLQVNERFSERPIFEAPVKASTTITPGHVIQFDAGDVKSALVGAAYPYLAVENPYIERRLGDGLGYAIDTAYDPGTANLEPCRYIIPQRGDMAYCLVDAGANVAKDAKLVVANTGAAGTAGTLVPATPDATTVVGTVLAVAVEAVNNSGGGTPARCKVRFL